MAEIGCKIELPIIICPSPIVLPSIISPASKIITCSLFNALPELVPQEGNAIGRVFLKGLDLGKSFGFGHPHRKKRSHKRKGHRKGAGTHSTRMHRRKAVHKRGRGVIIA